MLCKFFFPFLKASALCCYLLGTALCGVKRLESESHSVMSDSFRPHGLYNRWNSPGQNTGVCSQSLLQGIFPTQGQTQISQVDSLPAEPQGKSKNKFLQHIFSTQESNQGLLNCRWILYRVISYFFAQPFLFTSLMRHAPNVF